jgi:hypothetical protein
VDREPLAVDRGWPAVVRKRLAVDSGWSSVGAFLEMETRQDKNDKQANKGTGKRGKQLLYGEGKERRWATDPYKDIRRPMM